MKTRKLEELLEKCKANIKENKEKVRLLTEENEKLKQNMEQMNQEVNLDFFSAVCQVLFFSRLA